MWICNKAEWEEAAGSTLLGSPRILEGAKGSERAETFFLVNPCLFKSVSSTLGICLGRIIPFLPPSFPPSIFILCIPYSRPHVGRAKTYMMMSAAQVWASLVAQRIKCLPAMQETRFDPWVGKIPWRREWQPSPVLLPGESHGQRSLAGYSPWGHKELDMTERLHLHFHSTGIKWWITKATGFPGSASGRKSTCQYSKCKRCGSIPGSGRSPGEDHGNPLQSSCLENPMESGPWQATVHRVTTEAT